MKLLLIDASKTVEHDINWVELNTPVGNMVIQNQHVPMVVELSSGQEIVFETTEGVKHSFLISQAVAHVSRTAVKILTPLMI